MPSRSRRRRGAVVAAAMLTALSIGVAAPSSDTAVDALPVTSRLVPVGPIRLADTRNSDCGCTHVDASTLTIDVAGNPDVPDGAIAVAITVTALHSAGFGHVTVYPNGTARPEVSTLNTRPDRVVANSAIVPLGADGALAFHQHTPGDLVVDVTAAFVPATTSRAGRFVGVAPRRLVDTRTPAAPSGVLAAGGVLNVPLPAGVAADATAVVVNVTSVGAPAPGHLSARPSQSDSITTSFLNVNGSGDAVAATIVVPVDSGGFDIVTHSGGHLIVDFAGWFTGDSAADTDVGLFVPHGPERLLDTRLEPGRIWEGGTIELASSVSGARALVTNVTVTLPDRRGHVTAYPARTALPGTSNVNPAFRDHTVANLAISTLSTQGIAYRSHAGTDLVVDMTGWFTGAPLPTTTGKAPNNLPDSRVLVVGDSVVKALDLYTGTSAALVGADFVIDADNCRKLFRRSCLSPTTHRIPNTAEEAILGTPGRLDVVVITVGHNDHYSFPEGFDAVVHAARAKGAHTIVWQTYNDHRGSDYVRQALLRNNADLWRLTALPEYSDVIIADWKAYATTQTHWFWDGNHMTKTGAYAQADYFARWMAHLERRPCPQPWTIGGPILDPCPRPEAIGPVPNPIGLYV